MALGEALGSHLLVDFEEGIAHEVEVLQCLSLRGWPELIEVTRQAVLIVVADIYIELLPEVVLDVLLDFGHRRRIQWREDRALGIDLVRRRPATHQSRREKKRCNDLIE